MSLEGRSWGVRLNPDYLKKNPDITSEKLKTALSVGPWYLPVMGSPCWIPGMGTTGNGAMPTAVLIEEGKTIHLFVKPYLPGEHFIASNEFEVTRITHRRGVNVPETVALLKVNREHVLIGELLHAVTPLSAWRLDYRLQDPRVYSPRDFIGNFVQSIADLHDKGIVHRDLHLGNIGYEFSKDSPPRVVFFDFEISSALSDDDLRCKTEGLTINVSQKLKMEQFEEDALVDLGTFVAHLRYNGFPMTKREILSEVVEAYLGSRKYLIGSPSEGQIYRRLLKAYLATTRSLRYHRKERQEREGGR